MNKMMKNSRMIYPKSVILAESKDLTHTDSGQEVLSLESQFPATGLKGSFKDANCPFFRCILKRKLLKLVNRTTSSSVIFFFHIIIYA